MLSVPALADPCSGAVSRLVSITAAFLEDFLNGLVRVLYQARLNISRAASEQPRSGLREGYNLQAIRSKLASAIARGHWYP